MPALLVIEDVRLDVDGVPAVDGLTLRTTAERTLVLGAPRALFEAAAGLRPVVRGRVLVRDAAPDACIRARTTAAAPFDPPLPPKWTPSEYVSWSARLAGLARLDAAAQAKDALARLQLAPLATTPLARLVPHARRGVVIAAALAIGAPVLLLEDPLGALPEEAARNFGKVLGTALEGRSWIAFAPRVPLTSPLALQAEEAVVVNGARVDAQGAPAEIAAAVKRFSLRTSGPLDALAAKLTQRGARMHQEGSRVVVDLGDSMTTADLLGLAGEAQVTILELHPVSRALA